MFVSVFDLFKIGVGPSSSHTMGPMIAARRFADEIAIALNSRTGHFGLTVTLFGSLAHTGVGHGTRLAIYAGLLGFAPDDHQPEKLAKAVAALKKAKKVPIGSGFDVQFDPPIDLIADRMTRKERHPNALQFEIKNAQGETQLKQTYYSIGGGFVLDEAEIDAPEDAAGSGVSIPYPFHLASEMLSMGEGSGLSIAQMKRANEIKHCDHADFDQRLETIWSAMNACMMRGLEAEGELPGGLGVKRRAAQMYATLVSRGRHNDRPLHSANDWLAAYAMAVNEENADGGQVVTAPTNGASGVLPAVIRYYLDQVPDADATKVPDMLLTAAAIGGLIKSNASISGAEVGCQGEVGSASAMAAAALCAVIGGTNSQIENAAEIALEHHLGLTCDPVKGLVQIPCIERNGMGAVKAVAAASLAVLGDGHHIVSLDACIATMRQTGRDMDERYKETSLAGLSVNLPEC